MEKDQKKKEYQKPEVTRITLDAKCAVLGFCKQVNTGTGPAAVGCSDGFGSSCLTIGS
jgi:hypothetical protein